MLIFIYAYNLSLDRFDKGYNFVIENASIGIHMRKIRLHKISNTFAPRGTWLLPWAT
jgi:hypothetical protein